MKKCRQPTYHLGWFKASKSVLRADPAPNSNKVGSGSWPDCGSSNKVQHVYELPKVSIEAGATQAKAQRMTILEPTEQDLSSNNLGPAPSKPGQWQQTQNVASFRHLFHLILDPNSSQEIDLVDQDTCLSHPCDTFNAESFGEHLAAFQEDQEQAPMPTCTQSSAGTVDAEPVVESISYPPCPAACQEDQEQGPIYTRGTGLSSHADRFNGESVLYAMRPALHQEDLEQVQICTQGTSHSGKFNTEHVGEPAHPAGVHEDQDQRPLVSHMQGSDQSHQFYGAQSTEFSVSPVATVQDDEVHGWQTKTKHHTGTCNTEPKRHMLSPQDTVQKVLMQGQALTSNQCTRFRSSSDIVNTNPLGEPTPVASKMQCPNLGIDQGTPLWSCSDTDSTLPFPEFRPPSAAVQDPGWVATNTHGTHYRCHPGTTNVESFVQGQPLPNIQRENFLGSAVCSTDSLGRQVPLPAVIQDNHMVCERAQPRSASTNTHDSNLLSCQGTCNPQACGGLEPLPSPPDTVLEGQVQGCTLTNTGLLHQFGAYNANPFVLATVPKDQVQGYAPTNTDLLHQLGACNANSFVLSAFQGNQVQGCALTNTDLLRRFGTCNANYFVESSPLDMVNLNRTILTTDLEGLESHSNNNTDDVPMATTSHLHQSLFASFNAGARSGQPSRMVSKWGRLSTLRAQLRKGEVRARRLSTLRAQLRKGESSEGRCDDKRELDLNKELQQKPKRKKLRAKVARDTCKSKARRGSKTDKGKDISQGTELDGDGKVAEARCPSFGETSNSLREGITKKSLCQDDGQASFGLLCHGGTVYNDQCPSAGSGFSINRQESPSWHEHPSTAEDQLAVPNSGTHSLVDYLALSDQNRHAEMGDPLPGNALSLSTHEPERLASAESRELVLYSQCSDQPENRHSQGSNLPLCLFSGETSSTGSTELVLAQKSSSHLPLVVEGAPNHNLQLVIYNQKRDIVVSKLARTFRKIRAKVQLDIESQRVWLQLENGGGPQADSDPGRARHWEKERDVMKKKVEFFIHKMHVVQGDRRFSPWKGSIVDSVVGAFLTQNVSDHLSSSAFMSVASRFPPVPKDSVVACADEICTIPSEKQCDAEVLSLIMERGFSGSAEELSVDKQGDINSSNCLSVDESTAVEVSSGEVTGFCKPVQHEDRRLQSPVCDYEGDIGIVNEGYYNALISTLDLQPSEKKDQNLLLESDDERNSSCAIEVDVSNGSGAMEDICGAFRQCCTSRNSKALRMLNFGTQSDKQEPQSCLVFDTGKQVGIAPIHDTEAASDNISDQQSESESAVGSSSSVQSVQDSNFQLATIHESSWELDFQDNIVQTSSQDLDTAIPQVGSKTSKKRPLSVSSVSGIERAQLEASQKGRKKIHHRDWETVRKQVLGIPHCAKEDLGGQKPRHHDHQDSVNWDAVRQAELGELAETIKERGMHHILSGRIKAFLTSLYEDHGSVDLEWLRNLSTEEAREYLMSIHGLGVKSVECIRLLTLHHLAFPVDTNVGRICVRLGWVPIEPLPEEVQLHLVELYPIQETIQKYLWPRLCTLDQRTLYELHYQLITFGKVFCTKSKPNCNACPMRTECKHFASAYASAKPLLTGPKKEQSNRICSGSAHKELPVLGMDTVETALLDYPHDKPVELSLSEEGPLVSEIDSNTTLSFEYHNRPLGASYSEDFYVEEPASPEPTYGEDIMDIEDMGAHMYIYKNYNDYSLDLIGNDLSLVQSMNHSLVAIGDQCSSQDTKNVHTQSTLSTDPSQFDASHSLLSKDQCCSPYQCSNGELASTSPRIPYCGSQSITRSDTTSDRPAYPTDIIIEVSQNAIVPVPEVAQIPAPKLKNIGRLRTIHYVYELPDGHSLLKMVDVREKDDPCSYLLAIWSPGETPESQQEIDELCRDESSMHSADKSFGADETVSGTLLIPCRTAMHGSFPLNGTYFQVNEVFADHESSLHPLQVPRSLIWSLRRRFVYFGTSVPNIFKGLSTDEIKDCFWRGHVCVRGFDRQTRAPKPLVCRLHFPISKQQQKTSKKHKGKKNDEKSGISSTLHK